MAEHAVSGMWEATITADTPGGRRVLARAVYDGDPLRCADARLVGGDNFIRDGFSIVGNAGQPAVIDASGWVTTTLTATGR